MISTIIFDMGGVLMDFDADRFLSKYPELMPADREILFEQVFTGGGWRHLDHGAYSDEEYVEIVCRRMPKRLHYYVEELIMRWDDPIVPIEGTADIVRELKAGGYKIYLLSNAGPRQKDYFKRVPGNECFDASVVSAYEKIWKPMPEIYQLLLDRYDLRPEECIFIDDIKENVDAAADLGIDAIQFTNAEDLRAELEKREIPLKSR